MLKFHGIQFHDGVPERFETTIHLTQSLEVCCRFIKEFAGDQKNIIQAINREIDKIYNSSTRKRRNQKELRHQIACWVRAKDIVFYIFRKEVTRELKLNICNILLKPVSVKEKWDQIETLLLKEASYLYLFSPYAEFSDSKSEVNLLLQMVVLFFLEQDPEIPPPNIQLRFISKQFPLTLWDKFDGHGGSASYVWTPQNLYCRRDFLATRLISASSHWFSNPRQIALSSLLDRAETKSQVIAQEEKKEEGKEIIQTNKPLIPYPEGTVTEVTISYIPKEEEERDSQQLFLIPETPIESLNSFQRTLQKKYSHDGIKHFLGIMRQLAQTPKNEVCEFDIQSHLELVCKTAFARRSYTKHLQLARNILKEMENLKVTRSWENQDESTNSLVAKIGTRLPYSPPQKRKKNSEPLPRLYLLLDQLFYPDPSHGFGLGSVLALIQKEVFQESTRQHPLLPGLYAYLAGTWFFEFAQSRGVASKTAEEIFEGCAFNVAKSAKYRMLNKLKSELSYMEEQKYITKCSVVKGKGKNPWKDRYQITAPKEFVQQLELFYQPPPTLPEK